MTKLNANIGDMPLWSQLQDLKQLMQIKPSDEAK